MFSSNVCTHWMLYTWRTEFLWEDAIYYIFILYISWYLNGESCWHTSSKALLIYIVDTVGVDGMAAKMPNISSSATDLSLGSFPFQSQKDWRDSPTLVHMLYTHKYYPLIFPAIAFSTITLSIHV